MSHQTDTDYLTVSSRIHAMENRLLTRERMERMIDARQDGDAVKVLSECGYGDVGDLDAGELEQLLARARAAAFHDLSAAVPDRRVVEVFQLKYDYHNAKVLIKAERSNADPGHLMMWGGRYDPKQLLDGFQRGEFWKLTPTFRAALVRAKELLASSGDPQLADFLLDRAYYQEMTQLAADSGSSYLQGYVRLSIDVANLRIAVRSARLEKGPEFLKLALIPQGSVSERAISAARGEELSGLFQSGPLSRAAALGAKAARPESGPLTEFERLCDNALADYLSAARRVAFGVETVVGYLYAKEAELTAIRTIMAGRRAGLEGDTIRARLRETYV